MADVVDGATRSRMMAGIRSTNTRPELTIRRALHRFGLRYRLHQKGTPGRPDMVFKRHNVAVFVHGCFWHGHDCRFYRLPQTRPEFWQAKIAANRKRDLVVSAALQDAGWRQLVIWECAIRGKGLDEIAEVSARAERFIRSRARTLTIRGTDGAH